MMSHIAYQKPYFMTYLHNLRREIALATALFVIGIFIALLVRIYSPEYAASALGMAEEFVSAFADTSALELLLLILLNNLVKIFLFMLAGIFFGIAPVLFLVLNGFVLGIVVSAGAAEHGLLPLLSAIIPHGVFELPAAILGAAVGLHLSVALFRRLSGRDVSLRAEVGQAVGFFARVLVPLLVVAAFVEVFVTPAIVSQLI